MLIYFFFIFVLYFLFVGLITYGWQLIKAAKNHDLDISLPFVSVVIAVRNEEKNIPDLLEALAHQILPKDQFEVIIVNDQSDDNTVKIIENFMKKDRFLLRLVESKINPNQETSPKKNALLTGIESSKGEIIVMTDGDCLFGKSWLKTMVSPFAHEEKQFVSGPVVVTGGKGLLAKLQATEFSSLMGSGGAMINLKYPLMCNGANLAFRKSAFYHVNGYEGNIENSSGDDVFLMQKIHLAFKSSVGFVKSSDAIVSTLPQPGLSELINQRKRWASKWDKFLLRLSWSLPVFLFIHYLSFIVGIALLIHDFGIYWSIGFLIFIKILFDLQFLKKISDFIKLPFNYWVFLISEILYPFYAIFFGVIVHFGNYQWKGRTHKR